MAVLTVVLIWIFIIGLAMKLGNYAPTSAVDAQEQTMNPSPFPERLETLVTDFVDIIGWTGILIGASVLLAIAGLVSLLVYRIVQFISN